MFLVLLPHANLRETSRRACYNGNCCRVRHLGEFTRHFLAPKARSATVRRIVSVLREVGNAGVSSSNRGGGYKPTSTFSGAAPSSKYSGYENPAFAGQDNGGAFCALFLNTSSCMILYVTFTAVALLLYARVCNFWFRSGAVQVDLVTLSCAHLITVILLR